MRFIKKSGNKPGELKDLAGTSELAEPEAMEPELREALVNFRLSIHAWSEAEYSRERTAVNPVRRRSWRVAAGWALGCALVVGSVSGGLFERHHSHEQARIAAEQRAAELKRRLVEQKAEATEPDEALLAEVDSDVSRQIPSAMEPLAQLAADDETR
ncbi:MAG: hypothetical protein ABR956_10335 [Terracidiphilus sp.]|jgi:hypothetical protein